MNFAIEETLLYDLSNRPASFDIVTCLAVATGLGMKHVRFVLGQGWKRKNYTTHQAVDRFISIVEPSVGLYGIDYSVGERYGLEINHLLVTATIFYRNFGRIGKIKRPCNPQNYITITLRKSRNPERDSKTDEWLEFAKRQKCEVIVLKDWDEQKVTLEERWKLYANAKMNLGVINGPMTLLFHSDAPYICMRTIGCDQSMSTSPAFSRINGITPGFQFPWAIKNQRLSYLDDTADNIESELEAMIGKERIAA